jgi:DNA-binding NtrC family response regulator
MPESSSLVPRILLVDDEVDFIEFASAILEQEGFRVVTTHSGAEALQVLRREKPRPQFELVVLDERMSGLSGTDALREIKQTWPFLPVVMLSAYAEEKQELWRRMGAHAVVSKGSIGGGVELSEMVPSVMRAIVQREGAEAEKKALATVVKDIHAIREFWRERVVCLITRLNNSDWTVTYAVLSSDPLMQEVYREAHRAAQTSASVLITGENGTGKEIIALLIHHLSHRRDRDFVEASMAALSPSLVEAELFGTVRGAYTEAVQRSGLLERAVGGSLFLDEIGETPQELQPKLLKVLDDKMVTRVGGEKGKFCDVKILAGTNRDLAAEVERGTFRKDLFFRFQHRIHLPPLRERRDDVETLARFFLHRTRMLEQHGPAAFTDEAVAALRAHDWPGNVRELAGVVQITAAAHGEAAHPITVDEVRAALAAYRLRTPGGGAGGMGWSAHELMDATPMKEAVSRFRQTYTRRWVERVRMADPTLGRDDAEREAARRVGLETRVFRNYLDGRRSRPTREDGGEDD